MLEALEAVAKEEPTPDPQEAKLDEKEQEKPPVSSLKKAAKTRHTHDQLKEQLLEKTRLLKSQNEAIQQMVRQDNAVLN